MQEVITIKQEELKSRYGIDIPKGEYGVNNDGKKYYITQANGDSSGCILVGQNLAKGKVLNSTITFNNLYTTLLRAKAKGEEIKITITL